MAGKQFRILLGLLEALLVRLARGYSRIKSSEKVIGKKFDMCSSNETTTTKYNRMRYERVSGDGSVVFRLRFHVIAI